jgi:hypothetical protein
MSRQEEKRNAMNADVIPLFLRVHKHLRTVDSVYIEAEDKIETRMVLQAHVNELRTLHGLLPPPLREKSWILTIERHKTA